MKTSDWIMFVTLVILAPIFIVLSVVLIFEFYSSRTSAALARQCVTSMQTLQRAVEIYDMVSDWVGTLKPGDKRFTPEELFSRKYLEAEPRCPKKSDKNFSIEVIDPKLRTFTINCHNHGNIEKAARSGRGMSSKDMATFIFAEAVFLFLAAFCIWGIILYLRWKSEIKAIKAEEEAFIKYSCEMVHHIDDLPPDWPPDR